MTATTLRTPRLQIRPYEEADAEARRELIEANDAHVRPWIPWMKDEPMSLAATQALLRGHAERFRSRELFRYVIVLADSGCLIGETGLYPRIGPGGLEAGYLVDHRHCGRGYAAEATAAMVRVAFDVERVQRVELHCAVDNIASNVIPPRLAFTLDAVREPDEAGAQPLNIWVLREHDYLGSPAATLPVVAWSEGGERLF